ncbi:hypothetical protein [Segetibacter aerophilus]|uniref:Phage protein n=1 Tax=Segetibacter aerophilus TaxID=670293 RepID=A0A512B9W6_9BACT|nr:hypothetical protein [Segetibacter aerophilus]GEO08751.1 hypothetical protein SAE01_12470 [Segetibacter aerophilus]
MPKFRKKPVVIEAIQYTGKNQAEIISFTGNKAKTLGDQGTSIMIPTLEGDMYANAGDFIIRGVSGEFYPCKPDIFEITYEPAD